MALQRVGREAMRSATYVEAVLEIACSFSLTPLGTR